VSHWLYRNKTEIVQFLAHLFQVKGMLVSEQDRLQGYPITAST
jgi:hypothetical protein